MKVVEVDHGLELLPPGPPRSAGLHMSDIYTQFYKELEPKRFDKRDPKTGEPLPWDEEKMAVGMAFEQTLEKALAAMWLGAAYRPTEQYTQHAPGCPIPGGVSAAAGGLCPCGAGIAYNPDHIFEELNPTATPEDIRRVLGEFKATFMSSRSGITDPKFDKWYTQMKLYCYHLGTLHARLYVMFILGDYTRPYTPKLRRYDILFTPQDLEDEWVRMRRFAQHRGMLPV